MSNIIPANAWTPAEDEQSSSYHSSTKTSSVGAPLSTAHGAAYMNFVPPRDADNICYRMYTSDNISSRYFTVLKPKIQEREIILRPIQTTAREMARPYVEIQGTQPRTRQLLKNHIDGTDFVLFPRAFDSRLELQDELLGNTR